MKLNNKLINAQRRPISREIYNFIGIVKTYYDLPDTVTDHIVYIFSELHYKYKELIGQCIPYENTVLAATIYADTKFRERFTTESSPIDVTEFARLMYNEDVYDKNIKQVYFCLLKIECLFN